MLTTNRGSVTVSAFGYGETGGGVWGGCDHDFLTAFSGQGNGNYAYVKNPDDALGAFGKELGGLLSTYATDLRLEIEPVKGHRVSEVITNVKHEEDVLGLVEIPISDIMSEETRHFVFKTKLAKQNKAFPRESTVFNVKLTFSVLAETGAKEVQTTEAKARVRFVREADVQDKADPTVEEIVALHQVIQAQLKAEEEAKKGRYDEAQGLMAAVARRVHKAGYAHVAAVAQNVSHRLGASEYSTSSGFLRSVANGGTRAYGTSGMDRDAASLLVECDVSLGNSSMEFYQSSFQADAEPEPVLDQAQFTPPRVIQPTHDPRFQWVRGPTSSTLLTGGPSQPVTSDHVYVSSSTDKSE
jgi:Ca-activated chloride channel family protein